MNGYDNSKVAGIYAANSGTIYSPNFPKHLERFFPNLIAIQIRFGGMTTITSNDLAPWPKLIVISLRDNKFETLDGDLFQYTPDIAWIEFHDNILRNVGANLLFNLNKLVSVNFLRNGCIDFLAGSAQQIVSLKTQLLMQCPGQCTTRCSLSREFDEQKTSMNAQLLKVERIETLLQEHAQELEVMRSQAERDAKKFEELYRENSALRSEISQNGARIARLERILA